MITILAFLAIYLVIAGIISGTIRALYPSSSGGNSEFFVGIAWLPICIICIVVIPSVIIHQIAYNIPYRLISKYRKDK